MCCRWTYQCDWENTKTHSFVKFLSIHPLIHYSTRLLVHSHETQFRNPGMLTRTQVWRPRPGPRTGGSRPRPGPRTKLSRPRPRTRPSSPSSEPRTSVLFLRTTKDKGPGPRTTSLQKSQLFQCANNKTFILFNLYLPKAELMAKSCGVIVVKTTITHSSPSLVKGNFQASFVCQTASSQSH